MKCILPFSKCPYLLESGKCQDGGLDAPFNGDSKCLRLSGKKKMIIRAKVKSTSDLYDPLQVTVLRSTIEQKPVSRVFVGEKQVAFLEFDRKSKKHGYWHLPAENLAMASNELDAVNNTLKILGYILDLKDAASEKRI